MYCNILFKKSFLPRKISKINILMYNKDKCQIIKMDVYILLDVELIII